MNKVSVIIPVYKDGNIKKIVEKILEDPYKNKEIIIVADCPVSSLLEELNYLKNYSEIKIKISKTRLGKVKAVNCAVKESNGDILIFFDADLEIKNINISKIVDACKKYEIVDFVKIVKPIGLWGKMIYVESIMGYLLSKVFSHIRKSILLSGTGFAIRREVWEKVNGYQDVVLEDVDLATRIYINGGNYFLLEDVELEIFPPKNFSKWIDQRIRWIYGGLEWTTKYYKQIIKFFVKYPLTLLFYLILNNPALALIPIFIIFKSNIIEKLITTLLIILISKYYLLLLLVPLTILFFIVKTLIFFVIYLITIIIVFISFSIAFKRYINIFWILLYLFLYSPIYSMLMVSVSLRYLINKKAIKFDWKL